MNKSNLKPWAPGTSGNPSGRPKGTRSIKKVIVDMLNDPNTYDMLPNIHPRGTQTPLEAIVSVLVIKSIRGDVRAIDTLLKYSVDRDDSAQEPTGFFHQTELVITVVDSKGDLIEDHPMNTTIPKPIKSDASQLPDHSEPDPYAGQFANKPTAAVAE